ncbi:hypothetical protein MCELHM10_01752 [Paracoccaceae bacterium]
MSLRKSVRKSDDFRARVFLQNSALLDRRTADQENTPSQYHWSVTAPPRP